MIVPGSNPSTGARAGGMTGRAPSGLIVLAICALLAFAVTLIAARAIGLSTAEPSHRMRFHAIPVAMSQLYHGWRHDYTGSWQVAMPFQGSPLGTQELIFKAVTQAVPANDQVYFWTADDRGLSDFVYGAFTVFGPSVPSLFYFWFLLLGASLCAGLFAYRRDPLGLATIACTMIAIGIAMPLYMRAGPEGVPVHLTESRMFDVLGAIALVHVLLSILRPARIALWSHAGALLIQIGLLAFLLHTRSTLIWMVLVILLVSLTVTLKRWIDGAPAGAWLRSLSPAALMLAAWVGVLGYQAAAFNPEYRSGIGPRTVWHNVLMGFFVSPTFADTLVLPGLFDRLAVDAVLRDMKERNDPRLGPGWDETNILNSLGGHSRFDWATYEAVSRSLVLRSLAGAPGATLKLALWDKPKALLASLNCSFLRLSPSCDPHMGIRDHLRPTKASGLISAFWLALAALVGVGLAQATRAMGEQGALRAATLLPLAAAAILALLMSLLLSYLFYPAPYQFGGTSVLIALCL